MVAPMPGKDPGWGRPSAILLLGFGVPPRSKDGGNPNLLVAIRQLFVSFVLGLGLFGVVLVLIGHPGGTSIDPTAAAGGVLAYGLVTYVVAGRIKTRLPCSSIGELLAAYRARLFVRVAFAESAALVGFVLTFQCDSLLPYAAGLIPAALGFIRLAPTRARLQREQNAMRADGCSFGLYDVLCEATLGGQAATP
jgi:hypothetical protein